MICRRTIFRICGFDGSDVNCFYDIIQYSGYVIFPEQNVLILKVVKTVAFQVVPQAKAYVQIIHIKFEMGKKYIIYINNCLIDIRYGKFVQCELVLGQPVYLYFPVNHFFQHSKPLTPHPPKKGPCLLS